MIKDKLPFINGMREISILENLKEEGIILVKCPKCGSVHIVKNGHYTRKIAHITGSSSQLSIQKYLCRDCSTSFKELPFSVSSNNHYSNYSLLKILIEDRSINAISKCFDVSRNTVKLIKNKFKADFNRLMVLVNKYTFNDFQSLYETYFKIYGVFLFDASTRMSTAPLYVFRLRYPLGG